MLRSCKKASAVICVLLVMVCFVTIPVNAVSWVVYSPVDHIRDVYYEGNYRYAVLDMGGPPLIQFRYSSEISNHVGSVNVMPNLDPSYPLYFNTYPLGAYCVSGPPLSATSGSGGRAIDVSDIKPDATTTLSSKLKFDFDFTYWSYDIADEKLLVECSWYFYGYDEAGNYLSSINRKESTYPVHLQDQPETYVYELPVEIDLDFFGFPSGVRYIVPYMQVKVSFTQPSSDITIGSINYTFEDFTMTLRTDMLLKDSMTLEAIEDQLADANDKLDQIIDQPEQEKQEANQSGSSVVDELLDVLPDRSEGFMTGIRMLADAMSYEGTEAALTFPAIRLPEIPGVMKSYKLSEDLPIDFGFWVQKIPGPILTLVQVILTIALVVYSFKELYSMIAYAMTLKGGSGNG